MEILPRVGEGCLTISFDDLAGGIQPETLLVPYRLVNGPGFQPSGFWANLHGATPHAGIGRAFGA